MKTQDQGREAEQRAWEVLGAVRNSPRIQQWLSEADVAFGARRRLRFRQWTMAAGIGIVAVGLGVVAYLHWSFQRYETQIGEQRDVVLADGSRVTLNTNTAITVHYSRNRRFIDLTRGEALFSVQHAADRPFDVVASGVLTRALGTEFNVDVRSSNITVSVLDGAVRVSQPPASEWPVFGGPPEDSTDAPGAPAPTALGKGQALEVMPAEHRMVEEKADRRRIDAWRARRLDFNDTPLSDAVEEFNRYSTLNVVVGTPDLGAVRVSGVFRIGDTQGFLFSLREALNIETHETQGGVVLMRPSQ